MGVATTEDWIAGYKKQNHCVNKTTKKKIEKKKQHEYFVQTESCFHLF